MHTPLTPTAPGAQQEEAGMQIQGAIREYQHVRRSTGYAKLTLRNEQYHLDEFARIVGDDLTVGRLNRRHVEAFIGAQSVCEATLRTKLSTIRGFCVWAIENGKLRRNPCEAIKLPKVPRRLPRECGDGEVEKLYATLPDTRAVLIVSLMRQELLRRREVAGLEVGDLDLTSRWLLIRHGKGGHEGEVPISDDTHAAVHAYLAESPASSGPLIRSYNDPHRGLGASYIGILVSRWMKEAGIKRFPFDGKSAHALRHTGAGAMLDEGADIRDVQDALRHASLAATYVYLRGRRGKRRLRDAMGRRRYIAQNA